MTSPTLSLCVPTYNRAAFLDYFLTHIAGANFPFPIEIVVSDNASTDNTKDIIDKHTANGQVISYYRHETNQGVTANYYSALRRGRGRFVMYVADDDLLIPDALVEAVQFLMDNPSVMAAYAPWILYDDVLKQDQLQFYHVDKNTIYEPGEEILLLKFIIERHVFPEILVYRADAVRSLFIQGHFTFQFFMDLARVSGRGPVAFLAKPFYRSVTNSPLRRAGEQVGMGQVMTDWDTYRGGLEYFVYSSLRRAGADASEPDKLAIRDAIEKFLDVRMAVAQRLWLGKRDFVRAYEILCRRKFLTPAAVATEAASVGNIQRMVAFQSMARLANMTVGIDRVVMPDLENIETMAGVLRDVGLEERIKVEGAGNAAAAQTSLVLIHDEGTRQRCLDQGYMPGLIVSFDDLSAII